MSKVKVKISKPFHRVKILKGKEALVEETSALPPLEDLENDDELIEEDEEEEIEEEPEIPEPAVFYNEFSFCSHASPISISLDNIPPKAVPIEDVKKEVQEAYDNGFDDGQQIATSNFEAEIKKYREWMKRIDTIIEDLFIGYSYEVNKFEDALTNLSRMIAEQILQREISNDSKVIITQAKKAIDSLDDDEVFKIRLNPDDLSVLQDAKSELSSDTTLMENVVLSPDETIEKGGCILETTAGTIDARISKQLDILKKKLDEVSVKNIPKEESTSEIES